MIAFERGWLSIQARQIGYNAVFSLYLAKSTHRSNNFMMKLCWMVGCGGGVGSFLARFGGLPRLGLLASKSSSSSATFAISWRAPFNRPRATTISVAANDSITRTNTLILLLETGFFTWRNKKILTTSFRHILIFLCLKSFFFVNESINLSELIRFYFNTDSEFNSYPFFGFSPSKHLFDIKQEYL